MKIQGISADNYVMADLRAEEGCNHVSLGVTLGGGPFDSAGHQNQSVCMAVMYHYVHDSEPLTPGSIPGLTSAEFSRQLDLLCSAMEPINWPMLYAWSQGRGALPKRCFLLTFDDGLADHARVVLPLLTARGLRAAFFVPGAILTERRLLPAHVIHILLNYLGEQNLLREIESCLAGNPGASSRMSAVDSAKAERIYHYESPIRARIKYLMSFALPMKSRDNLLGDLFERHVGSNRRWAQEWYLGWDDLMAMQGLGHTIGGHGHLHEPYTRLFPTQRCRDLEKVAEVLHDGLGSEIRPFSYPFGNFDRATCEACRHAGFAHAFTTEARWIEAGCDPLALPRFDTNQVDAVLHKERSCLTVP